MRLPHADLVKPGVRVLRETVTAIDPAAKRVATDAGEHEAGRAAGRATAGAAAG